MVLTPIVSGNLLYYQTQSTAFPSVLTLHALNIKDGFTALDVPGTLGEQESMIC